MEFKVEKYCTGRIKMYNFQLITGNEMIKKHYFVSIFSCHKNPFRPYSLIGCLIFYCAVGPANRIQQYRKKIFEGGGRRVQDGEHMYTCGGFILIFGKTNTIM